MNAIKEIYNLHNDIHCWLPSNSSSEDTLELHQGINACAYFVLMFSQFEKIINNAFRDLVGSIDDSSFMHQVNILSSSLIHNVVPDILWYYEIRCEIAHGRAFERLPFTMDEPFTLLSAVASQLFTA